MTAADDGLFGRVHKGDVHCRIELVFRLLKLLLLTRAGMETSTMSWL